MDTEAPPRSFSGTRLKAARERAGIGQREAARRLSVSRTTLWTAESGDSIPGGDLVGRMADLYEATTDSFFVHEENATGLFSEREENTPAPHLPPSGSSRVDGAKAGAR